MNHIEFLTKPGNPFDQNTRINQEHFKAIRDLCIDLEEKVKVLESKISRLEPKQEKKPKKSE